MKHIKDTLTFSLRQMAKTPTNTILCIFILAGCIALVTSMFRLCYISFLSKYPFKNSERIVSLVTMDEMHNTHRFLSLDTVDYIRENGTGVFSDYLTAFSDGTTIKVGNAKEMTGYCYIDWDFDKKLGVHPMIGRTFTETESKADGDPVALISEKIWKEMFGGSREVIGKIVSVFGRERTVIGVMPDNFDFPSNLGKTPGGVWLPMNRELLHSETGWVRVSRLYGILAPGISFKRGNDRVSKVVAQAASAFPNDNKGIIGGRILKLDGSFMPDQVKDLVGVTSICALLIFFMGCGIVSGLLTVRYAARTQELSIRSALGATRGRIVGLMLSEFLLVSASATFIGFQLDLFFERKMTSDYYSVYQLPDYLSEIGGGWMFAFTAGAMCLVTMVSSILPALRASKIDPASVLRDSARTGSSLHMTRLSNFVIAAQVAVACVVISGGAMIGGKILDMCDDEKYYDPSDYYCAQFSLDKTDFADDALKTRTFMNLLAELRKNPEIEKIGLTSEFFGRNGPQWGGQAHVAIDGVAYENDTDLPKVLMRVVSPGYFDSIDVPILSGRDFGPGDDASHQKVAAVTNTFARKYFGSEDVLGKRFSLWGKDHPPFTVIAVVPDIYNNKGKPELDTGVFFPYAQLPWEWVAVYLKGHGMPSQYRRFLEDSIRKTDSRLSVFREGSIRQLRDESNGAFLLKLILAYFSLFASGALLMAAGGLYGVISFSVNARRREMGIRTALGAKASGLAFLLAKRGVIFVAIGLCLGAAGTLLVRWELAGVFDGTLGDSWGSYALVAAVLLGISGAAILIPAIRGALVDPAKALHAES